MSAPHFRTNIISFFIVLLPFLLLAQVNVNINNIEIIRDEYGVPHIYADTDQEAVYGTAWAQCEDNFNMMQTNMAISKGLYGKIEGKEGAIVDFICQLFEIEKFVVERYEKEVSPKMDGFIKAYIQAINKYASLHPEEIILKEIFPLQPTDVLQGYIFNFILLSNAFIDVAKVSTNKMAYYATNGNMGGAGSNAMAYNKNKTIDGKTYLVGNPHQPIEGPSNFWEYSVHTKETLDAYGVTFSAGGVTPMIGCNKNLGWTHTTNYEDYADIFQLIMHPTKKDHYLFDGEWTKLEKKKAKLKVKIGPFIIPVKKKFYTSKYGPTLKNDQGYYSFKCNAFKDLRCVEQYYKMGIARNYDEFMDALNIQSLPSQTITYADKDDNIFFLSNAILPVRNEKYNWRTIVPGNTSETLWDIRNIHPIEELVMVTNPKSGYVYNSNNTPVKCTGPEDNPDYENYPSAFGLLKTPTARSKRYEKLISKYDKVSFENIRSIREDRVIDTADFSFRSFMNADDIHLILNKYPELEDLKKVFLKWNGAMTIDNKQAIIMTLVTFYISKYVYANFATYDNIIPESVIVDAFRKTKKFLLKNYNTYEVELGQVQKIVRGEVEYPIGGALQTLSNAHFELYGKKKLKCVKGDSFIMYAKYGNGGLESLQTVNVFGNSNKPESPNYTNQLELYLEQGVKNVELDADLFRSKSTNGYHPK